MTASSAVASTTTAKLLVLPTPSAKASSTKEGEAVAVHETLPELHFGVLLRRAREQRKLSTHDVAQKTRISVRWVEALEDARLDGLPAEVFVAGYLRSYARVVGLDGQEVLERYHALVRQREKSANQTERGVRGHYHKGTTHGAVLLRHPLLWVGLALLIVLALLFIAWHRHLIHT